MEATRHPLAIRGKRFRALPALTIGAAFVLFVSLRLRQSAAPLAFDEYASLYFSDRSFHELWGWWMLRETNPPLFYSVLKLWRWVVPESQATLRALPLLISLAQIGLLARFAARTYGWPAAALCLILFALSPSDIYGSEYVRGYALAKLAVTVSFLGLLAELRGEGRTRRGLFAYAAGAVVAIYCHTTMLAWPVIATGAMLIETALGSRGEAGMRRHLPRLLIADLVIVLVSAWALIFAVVQLRTRSGDIAWIEPLSLADYISTLRLQLFLDSPASSAAMALLCVVGVLRTWRERATRLSLAVAIFSVVLFKFADLIHPIVSDYTLHWCATFTTLLASAPLASRWVVTWPAQRRVLRLALPALTLVAMTALGAYELFEEVGIPRPQDWRYTVRTVARTPGAALLVSHESIGVIVQQACRLEFRRSACPFPLVVMANPAKTDAWAFGGYKGPIVPIRGVRQALGPARTVYAFSRYVYTPLAPLGLDPGDYQEVQWDDGELIGPIPIADFTAPA